MAAGYHSICGLILSYFVLSVAYINRGFLMVIFLRELRSSNAYIYTM
jgi:hypothetical protein